MAHTLVAVALLFAACAAAQPPYPPVLPGQPIHFPTDEGSHPEYRTEWWYVTGWLEDAGGRPLGFQVTFFRSRPGLDENNPSRFAARQLLFAHAAVSDPQRAELLRIENAARAGFGLAEAQQGKLCVRIGEWMLSGAKGRYEARVQGEGLRIELSFQMAQPPLLQGDNGFSRKGPKLELASYYYSLPQLQTSGTVWIDGEPRAVRGTSWFDHEWMSIILDGEALGWDWTGINLHDGGALMAFQMRDAQGDEHWASASLRTARQDELKFASEQVTWTALRKWRSPRTGVEYPIAWRILVGQQVFVLEPLMEDQENDARGSTGTLYWEGAVRALNEAGVEIGRGYLELTGYAGRVRL